jgi:NTP pyrophosphatase (non-canonical NTP hydrolase)
MEEKIEISLREYQSLCQKTAKGFDDKKTALSNWGLGVAGEAGDLAGCIKKTLFHGNDQTLGIRENIGDTMWYLAMICNTMDWNLEDILKENIEKLKARYPQGFNETAASRGGTRIDWNEKEDHQKTR